MRWLFILLMVIDAQARLEPHLVICVNFERKSLAQTTVPTDKTGFMLQGGRCTKMTYDFNQGAQRSVSGFCGSAADTREEALALRTGEGLQKHGVRVPRRWQGRYGRAAPVRSGQGCPKPDPASSSRFQPAPANPLQGMAEPRSHGGGTLV
ncbi:hypothetical protein llap_8227 [Limosa lapponica baueri]|uniref:Uncharacterized protein n=1 Tax=Limosa lapponica baueri TaxID=1758121 RepID=A0A2I0U5Y1_LIMLA|nr:hypothetical protein llap_8227 [Limosa lapponica baueri]